MAIKNKTTFVKVVAIDGPSGSGKSSMAQQLAKELGLLFIDTGAMYRALALKIHEEGLKLDQHEKLVSLIESIDIVYAPSEHTLIQIDQKDYTELIRTSKVSELASATAQIPLIREFLLNFQRGLVKERSCVMEGRDIGTVVFPEAFCKVFMTASSEVRAKRRFEQLKAANLLKSQSLEDILADVIERDKKDSERKTAPLVKAPDALLLQTDRLTSEQVIEELKRIVSQKCEEHQITL